MPQLKNPCCVPLDDEQVMVDLNKHGRPLAKYLLRIEGRPLTLVLAPLMTLGGYFVVYVSTPHDLQLHLETSLDRLLYHLWPAAVFIVFTLPVSMASELVAAAPISSDT